VADFPATRAGAILAVSDFGASLRFYRDQLGLTEEALYDDPPSQPMDVLFPGRSVRTLHSLTFWGEAGGGVGG
jgi:catechol 2,3-dioxygenase-like lactoylglutathione lyase family enzyme